MTKAEIRKAAREYAAHTLSGVLESASDSTWLAYGIDKASPDGERIAAEINAIIAKLLK